MSPGCILGTFKEPSMKRDARALFCDIPTYDKKDIEFQKSYELENKKIIFTFILLYIQMAMA